MGKKNAETREKPLEKMTATELREMAKDLPDITGAHGMNKPELVVAIKKAKGIKEDKPRKSRGSIREMKKNIRALRSKQEKAVEKKDKKMAAIFRRRISRLKKKSRRAVA
ncbi:MAG: transcription termination factor Rho [Deltaproteobacteria bacterium]|nr:MAG: transcription termination factor Rho [Deltaproteobacteria bacterium]RTZ99974.1 MAG: transcription termination factor Rho [Deltaproteobacteria bacterium]